MQRVHSDASVTPATAASSRWRALASRAMPLRYPLFVLILVLAVTAGQLIEDALDTPSLEMLTPGISIPRWALALLTLYMLVMLRVIQITSVRTLREVRSVVQVDDATYEGFSERMCRIPWRADIALALLALGFVVFLFPVLHAPLPIVRNPATHELTYLPTDPLNALIVLVAYWLVGWAALSLLVNTVRLGKALGELTRKPLVINIYDASGVVPLGRFALVLSLAPAGVILILLFGLGTPTGPLSWFSFILASCAAVLALVLPLRGVHHQMDRAKKASLGEINHELLQIQRETLGASAPDAARTAHLSNRTNTLVALRKVVQEGPTWPFRDSMAVSRAALVASAPLIYAVLNELIRIFIIAPLTR